MKVMELNRKGFTLIEVIVVAAIIAILAGILVPMIFEQIGESKVAKARGDVKNVMSAIVMFRKDTQKWPNYVGAAATDNTVTLLRGAQGNLPAFDAAATGWTQTVPQNIEDHLNIDDNTAYGATWKGSYLASANKDPWENAYLINADAFNGTNPVWVISAGPDGTVQTPATATEIPGGIDDIGIRIK